jgi:hypothetical protein
VGVDKTKTFWSPSRRGEGRFSDEFVFSIIDSLVNHWVIDLRIKTCYVDFGIFLYNSRCFISEAPHPQGGASRKGNFIRIVPLDPAYKAGLAGHVPVNDPITQ